MKRALLSIVVLLLATGSIAGAQVRVEDVEGAGGGLVLLPYAQASAGTSPAGATGAGDSVAPGAELAAGDLLLAGGGLDVEVACRGGSWLRLRGPFRLLVLAADSPSGCAFHLSAGELEAEATGPLRIETGGLDLRSEAGRYRLHLEATSPPEETAEGGSSTAVPVVHQRLEVLAGSVQVTGGSSNTRVAAGRVLMAQAPRGRPDQLRLTSGPLSAPADAERASTMPEPGSQDIGQPAPAPRPTEPGAAAAESEGETEPTGAVVATPAPQVAAPTSAAPAPPEPEADPVPSGDALRQMLSEERYDELIDILEPHVAATTSTSVACYALAEAYAAQKRWQRAAPMARRALQLDELDNLLTSRELARAQNLRSGPPP